jgi:hypothetical protein
MPFDGTKLDATTQLLIKAREVLVTNGWCTGHLVDKKGRHCAMGAIQCAMGYNKNLQGLAYGSETETRLADALPRGYWSVPMFNNDQTSVKPILELFDRAIGGAV